MSIYKDTKTKKWYSVLRYKNSQGNTKQTTKRGFRTKKEGQEWEREFLLNASFSNDMKFNNLCNLYFDDIKNRVKEVTYVNKKSKVNQQILPHFKDFSISDITALEVRKWQNSLMDKVNEKTGENYSSYYIKSINTVFKSIFSFAVKFHNLKENPVSLAGSMNLQHEKKMDIWTQEEFKRFAEVIEHRPITFYGYHVLFFTGLRIGELLALTRKDINLDRQTINIDKTYRLIETREVVTSAKTDASHRVIKINDKLCNMLRDYFSKFYDIEGQDRAFPASRYSFRDDMKRYHKRAKVKRIRLHDLRHSHASLLINAGVNPLAISKRLGHSKVDMTLNIYSHLYPSYDEKLMNILDDIY